MSSGQQAETWKVRVKVREALSVEGRVLSHQLVRSRNSNVRLGLTTLTKPAASTDDLAWEGLEHVKMEKGIPLRLGNWLQCRL